MFFKLIKIACLLSSVALFSCHTITIENDVEGLKSSGFEQEKWNHTGIFGLVNYSDNFRMGTLCPGGKWSRYTSEKGTLAAGAEFAMVAMDGVSPVIGIANFFWDPLTIRWVCARPK